MEHKLIQAIVDWTLPGLTMFYRDSNMPMDVVRKYGVGTIFRSRTFVDVSDFAGRPTKNARFIFASSKAAPMHRFNPDTQKWGLHAINCDSIFKVLDVYTKSDVTQVLALHIPAQGIEFFSASEILLGDESIDDRIIGKARASLDDKLRMELAPALEERAWLERTAFPIGIDPDNEFFPLLPTGPVLPIAKTLHDAIRELTGDTSPLNRFES